MELSLICITEHTVIRFFSISAKFGICPVVSQYGTLVKAKIRIVKCMKCVFKKGQCQEFFYESVSPKPLSIPVGPFRIILKIRRYSQIKMHHWCQLHWWQMEKNLQSEIFFIILFGYLWVVELTQRYLFFKFTLRCKQSDIVLINAASADKFATGVFYLRISPRIFEKIRNDPTVLIRGLAEDDSWKKTLNKNIVILSS